MIVQGHHGGEGSRRYAKSLANFALGSLAEQTLGPPSASHIFQRGRRRRRVSPPYQTVAYVLECTLAEQTLGPPSASHIFLRAQTAAKGIAALPNRGILFHVHPGRADARPSLCIAHLSSGTNCGEGSRRPTRRWRTLHQEPWPSRRSALPRHRTSFSWHDVGEGYRRYTKSLANFALGNLAEQTLGPPSASLIFQRARRRGRVSPPYQTVAYVLAYTLAEQTLGPPSASHTFATARRRRRV